LFLVYCCVLSGRLFLFYFHHNNVCQLDNHIFTSIWVHPQFYSVVYRGGSRISNIFAPPSAIGKNKICWCKIVIFHTKHPKIFAPPSARRIFFNPPPWIRPWYMLLLCLVFCVVVIVMFDFVLSLVSNIACASGFSILDWSRIQRSN
jgi:hypothetical protein